MAMAAAAYLEIQWSVVLAVLLVGIQVSAGLGLTTEVNRCLQPSVVCLDLQGLTGPASSPAHTTG